eukprot:1147287-Pelagomonas_calceolata.AAC.10
MRSSAKTTSFLAMSTGPMLMYMCVLAKQDGATPMEPAVSHTHLEQAYKAIRSKVMRDVVMEKVRPLPVLPCSCIPHRHLSRPTRLQFQGHARRDDGAGDAWAAVHTGNVNPPLLNICRTYNTHVHTQPPSSHRACAWMAGAPVTSDPSAHVHDSCRARMAAACLHAERHRCATDLWLTLPKVPSGRIGQVNEICRIFLASSHFLAGKMCSLRVCRVPEALAPAHKHACGMWHRVH